MAPSAATPASVSSANSGQSGSSSAPTPPSPPPPAAPATPGPSKFVYVSHSSGFSGYAVDAQTVTRILTIKDSSEFWQDRLVAVGDMLISSNSDGKTTTWRIDQKSGELEKLADNPSVLAPPRWADPSGKWLYGIAVLETPVVQAWLFKYSIDHSTGKLAQESTRVLPPLQQPYWSFDYLFSNADFSDDGNWFCGNAATAIFCLQIDTKTGELLDNGVLAGGYGNIYSQIAFGDNNHLLAAQRSRIPDSPDFPTAKAGLGFYALNADGVDSEALYTTEFYGVEGATRAVNGKYVFVTGETGPFSNFVGLYQKNESGTLDRLDWQVDDGSYITRLYQAFPQPNGGAVAVRGYQQLKVYDVSSGQLRPLAIENQDSTIYPMDIVWARPQ